MSCGIGIPDIAALVPERPDYSSVHERYACEPMDIQEKESILAELRAMLVPVSETSGYLSLLWSTQNKIVGCPVIGSYIWVGKERFLGLFAAIHKEWEEGRIKNLKILEPSYKVALDVDLSKPILIVPTEEEMKECFGGNPDILFGAIWMRDEIVKRNK